MQSLTDFLAGLAGNVTEEKIKTAFQRVRSELPPALAGIFTSPDVPLSTAQSEAETILGATHSRAAYLGRRLAGNDEPYGDYDEQFGQLVAESEAQWFEAVHADVQRGRYTGEDGEIDFERLESRAGNFEERLRGTANEAWVNTLADTEQLLTWKLGKSEDVNCTVCPQLAEDSPYPANALPTYPGANETPCLFNCGCELEAADGTTGF